MAWSVGGLGRAGNPTGQAPQSATASSRTAQSSGWVPLVWRAASIGHSTNGGHSVDTGDTSDTGFSTFRRGEPRVDARLPGVWF